MAETLLEVAKRYYSYGLSVIPVGNATDKEPIGEWKINTERLVEPDTRFDTAGAIGIVAGKVSGYLQCLDCDCKYDLTGTLFEDFIQSISDALPDLADKFTIERTPTGGYHVLFKCTEIEGNKKLAGRDANDEDRQKTFEKKYAKFLKEGLTKEAAEKKARLNSANEKKKVLLETRSEGGFFVCAPSPGYELVQGDFQNIITITPEQRRTILDCARLFHVETEETEPKYKKEYVNYSNEENPFDDYNSRGDIPSLLQEHGWEYKKVIRGNEMYLRPGGDGKWSAGWHPEMRLLKVFTTSSIFDSKTYNATQILTTLKFNGDYSETAKWLKANGYGGKKNPAKNKTAEKENKTETTIDDKLNFVSPIEENLDYLEAVRNGTFKLGATTGFEKLDEYFRFKEDNFVMVNGHDNTGKSICMCYLATLSAMFLDYNWIIYAAENKIGGIYRRLCEFYLCKQLQSMTAEEYVMVKKWVGEHFILIKNDDAYTYMQQLDMFTRLNNKRKKEKGKGYNAALIDPWNALFKDKKRTENDHEYDYDALGNMRIWIRKNHCSLYVNCHCVTESLRKLYPKEHLKYPGMPMPPQKADTEGGGKFASRPDDFLTIHRMPQHPEEWMWSEIHVRKIKEMETGGKQTFLEEPFRIKMVNYSTGFEDADGFNPVLNYHGIGSVKQISNTGVSDGRKTNQAVMPEKDVEYDMPF